MIQSAQFQLSEECEQHADFESGLSWTGNLWLSNIKVTSDYIDVGDNSWTSQPEKTEHIWGYKEKADDQGVEHRAKNIFLG